MVTRLGRIMLVLLFAVVVLAVLGAALYLGMHFLEERSGEELKTTSVLAKECPEKNAVVEIYREKRLPENILKEVVKVLQQYFGEGAKLGLCSIPWNHTAFGGRTLRVYPAIALKAEELPEKLRSYIVEEVGGLYVLNYATSIQVALTAGLRPEFTKEANVTIVNGTTPFSSVPRLEGSTLDKLKMFLEMLAAARIESVEVAPAEEFPWLNVYPSVIFSSTHNLSQGVVHIVSEHGLYVINRSFALQLAEVLGSVLGKNIAAEVRFRPPMSGVELGPETTILEAALYLDVHCSYSAMLVAQSLDPLLDLYRSGSAKLYIALGVLRGGEEAEAALQCYYLTTRNESGYIDLIRKSFSYLLEKKSSIPLDEVLKLIEERDPQAVDNIQSCLEEEGAKLIDSSIDAFHKLNTAGTPTIVLWNTEKKRGLVIVGYVDREQLEEIISSI